jgi:hypothetical protein
MTDPRPPRTLEEVENALIIAGLALRLSHNAKATREAMTQIAELKQRRAELRARAAA